jgi:parallel beta-helix repeat protein
MTMGDPRMPAAFLSYARFNDQHDHDRLTHLCTKLAGEIENVTGEAFHIFQDRRDIRTGQNWSESINESLDATTLFIAILTPSFFRSEACLSEVRRFLERERALQRGDLIIPVYYVDVPGLNGRESGPGGLFDVIRNRQYFDWRELRFEELDSSQTRRALNRLALHIREALVRFPVRSDDAARAAAPAATAPQPTANQAPGGIPAPPMAAEPTAQTPGGSARAAAEPPTHVVDAFRGPYASVAHAVSIASPGDRILVRPGTYDEGLVLDKPLEILGQGKPEEVVIQATAANALAFRTTFGRVANVTLSQLGGGDYFAVDIGQGRLTLEGCRIDSASLAGIAIHGSGADPIIRNNHIRRCQQSGLIVFDEGRGTLEENDIADNRAWGVVVRDAGNPLLRGNRIHDNEYGGVGVERGGLGRLEDNDIAANRREGVLISGRANPVLRRNTIARNSMAGVYVYDHGQGTVEQNEIRDNLQSGVAIRTGGNPTVQGNVITGNNGKGVWCQGQGAGIVTNNDLRGNAFGAFWKSDDCTTRYADNHE